MWQFTIDSEEKTAAFAESLAPHLRAGQAVLLRGTLGAGKTSFARALIRTLAGNPSLNVQSPTFMLVQDYTAQAGFPVLHYDLYRLEDESELWELGMEEACQHALSIIEWPDLAAHHLPKDQLEVHFEMVEDQPTARRIICKANAEVPPALANMLTQFT